MISVSIRRRHWSGTINSREDGHRSSCTRNEYNEMCCLGHVLVAEGVDMDMYPGVFKSYPYQFEDEVIPEWMYSTDSGYPDKNSRIAFILAELNDACYDTYVNNEILIREDFQINKEANIAYALEQYGYDVTFVD